METVHSLLNIVLVGEVVILALILFNTRVLEGIHGVVREIRNRFYP